MSTSEVPAVEDGAAGSAACTVTVSSVLIMIYSLVMMRSGLIHKGDPNYAGILLSGCANIIPVGCRRTVCGELAALTVNTPGIAIALWMYNTMDFSDSVTNHILCGIVLLYFTQRLLIGLLVPGLEVNIGDVLIDVILTCIFSYGHSLYFCQLIGYELTLACVFGLLVSSTGMLIHLYHDRKLRILEGMFETRISYTRGGLFNLVVAPQYLGEVMVMLGVFISAGTVIAAAHTVFILCHKAVLANIRHSGLVTRFGEGFDSTTKKLIPYIW